MADKKGLGRLCHSPDSHGDHMVSPPNLPTAYALNVGCKFFRTEEMINSKFINDILDLLLDGDSFGRGIRGQVDYLTEKEYNYTGVGLFVKFSYADGIEKFKSDNEKLILNGVIIKSREIEIGAEATVFCSNGLIDYLEIWSYDGVYPKKELETYTLTQEWTGSPGRQIIVE